MSYKRSFLLRDTQTLKQRTARVLTLIVTLWVGALLFVVLDPSCSFVYQSYQFVLNHFGGNAAEFVLLRAVEACDGV